MKFLYCQCGAKVHCCLSPGFLSFSYKPKGGRRGGGGVGGGGGYMDDTTSEHVEDTVNLPHYIEVGGMKTV